MDKRLPSYNTPSLEGPTPINRRTMPTRHVFDNTNRLVYTPSHSTDIRKTLKKNKQK